MNDTDKIVLEYVRIHANLIAACLSGLAGKHELPKKDRTAFLSVLRGVADIYADDNLEHPTEQERPANYHWIIASALAATNCPAVEPTDTLLKRLGHA